MSRDSWIFGFTGWHEVDNTFVRTLDNNDYEDVIDEDVLTFGDINIRQAKDPEHEFLYIVTLGDIVHLHAVVRVLVRSLPELYLLIEKIAPAKRYVKEYDAEFKRDRKSRRGKSRGSNQQ